MALDLIFIFIYLLSFNNYVVNVKTHKQTHAVGLKKKISLNLFLFRTMKSNENGVKVKIFLAKVEKEKKNPFLFLSLSLLLSSYRGKFSTRGNCVINTSSSSWKMGDDSLFDLFFFFFLKTFSFNKQKKIPKKASPGINDTHDDLFYV